MPSRSMAPSISDTVATTAGSRTSSTRPPSGSLTTPTEPVKQTFTSR